MLRLAKSDGRETMLPTEADAYEVRLRDAERDLWAVCRISGEEIAARAGGKFDAAVARAAVEATAAHMADTFVAYQARVANIPRLGALVIGPDGESGRIVGIDNAAGVVTLGEFGAGREFFWSQCRYAP
jgi:hypothetical protein